MLLLTYLVTLSLFGVALFSGRAHRRAHALLFAVVYLTRGHYLWWRLTSTLPSPAPTIGVAVSYAFFALEFLITYWLIFEDLPYYWHQPKADLTPAVERDISWSEAKPPRVDVLIPTFNEDWSVLEKTVIGALALDYPNFRAWVLDDGHREWLRERLEGSGVGYIARENPVHFKAGNLNHAVEVLTNAGTPLEFLALLDADFVPFPQLLRRTLALMRDPKVALVQTPQCYYNLDPFQKVFGGVRSWPDDMRLWFEEKQPRNDAHGRAECSGTSCLIRASAIADIGGFPVESVNDDTLCSITLRKHGWLVRYLNERSSVGIAPDGLGQFLAQRLRWQFGWLQLFQLWGAKPGFVGRLRYFGRLWKQSIVNLLAVAWFGVPVAYLLSARWLFQTPSIDALAHIALLWCAPCFMMWLTNGRQLPFVADVHRLVQVFAMWRMTFETLVLGRKRPFTVTDKTLSGDDVVVHWGTAKWLVGIALCLSFSLGWAVLDRRWEADGALFWLNAGFAGYLLLQVVAGLVVAVELPRGRKEQRFALAEPVMAHVDGRVLPWVCRNVSVTGASFEATEAGAPPEQVSIELKSVRRLSARLVRASASEIAYRFDCLEARPELIRKLYASGDYVPHPGGWRLSYAIAGFLGGVCRFSMRCGRLLAAPREHRPAEARLTNTPANRQ